MSEDNLDRYIWEELKKTNKLLMLILEKLPKEVKK